MWPCQVIGAARPLRLMRKSKCSEVHVPLYTQALNFFQQILVALWTSILQFIFSPFLCLVKDLEVILEMKHSYSNYRLSGTALTSFPAPQFNIHTQAGTSPHTPRVHTPCQILNRGWWQWALHVLNLAAPVKMTGHLLLSGEKGTPVCGQSTTIPLRRMQSLPQVWKYGVN